MGKKRVVEILDSDATSWTAPAGVTKIRAKSYLLYDRTIGDGWLTFYNVLPSGRVLWNGSNTKGQSGDEQAGGAADPTARYDVEVPEAAFVAGGENHSGQIMTNGWLYMMGENSSGQLGTGNTTTRSVPFQTLGMKVWRAITMGQNSTHAIDGDHKIWGWGINGSGQIGDGTITSRSVPVPVVGTARKYKQISSGAGHVIAVECGTNLAYTWGGNASGQLGDGTVLAKSSPIAVAGAKTWSRVRGGDTYNLGIDTAGVIWAWGSNDQGQLGDGTVVAKSSPIQVLGLPALTWVDVMCGEKTSYALASNGQIWAWGLNNDGQLGDGTVVKKSSPVQVLGTGSGSLIMKKLSAGLYHAHALNSVGQIWGWGINTNGRIGDGTLTSRSSPVLYGAAQTYTRTYQMATRRLMDETIFDVVPGVSYTVAIRQELMLFNGLPISSKTFGGMAEVELEYFKS